MTPQPASCRPTDSLREVAALMVEFDCGAIPVTDDRGAPAGIVTDRDITCRAVAEGKNAVEMAAADVMSHDLVTVTPDTDVEDCSRLMEDEQVRRLLVVDGDGVCVGILAQADLAAKALPQVAGGVVRQVLAPADARP
jgi:CBS domain-containing protein